MGIEIDTNKHTNILRNISFQYLLVLYYNFHIFETKFDCLDNTNNYLIKPNTFAECLNLLSFKFFFLC